jgi:TonB-dependent receptor
MKNFLTLIILAIATISYAQNGTIRGTVIEDASGEPVIGANVVIKGTSVGTITDLDGQFSLSLAAGTHAIQVSYITYQTLTIENVQVKDKEVTVLGELRLKSDNLELAEVVVTAEAVRNTEASLLTIKKKSSVIMDGISSAKMRLTGDATAVEAAKRVTGVSIEGGKYVYVRGLGDRYSKSMLNGVDIPGLDPDKNTLQMDIFPTNLINNIVVSKNFTADMPADFTGGLLNIETKDFPEDKILNVSASLGYNPAMHLNSDYLTYSGGKLDFLGFDDGTRALPARASQPNIPTPFSGASSSAVNEFVSSFNPELGAQRQTSPIDFGLGVSLGNQINLKKNDMRSPKLGYIFSLSYKADFKYYDEVEFNEYQRYTASDVYEMRYATKQTGEMGEYNVLVGALGGLAYKTERTKIRLTAMHLQNGESRAGKFTIDNDAQAVGQSGYIAYSDNLEYNQRALTNVFLGGTHVAPEKGWELEWKLSPTLSSSQDPDTRKTAFTEFPTKYEFNAGAGGNPSRIWRSLQEVNAVAKIDATKKYMLNNREGKLKFGASHTYKQRDYEILFFDIQFFGGQSWTTPDASTVLNPENIYPNSPNRIYYQSGNRTLNPNEYTSNINNTGVYFSNEYAFGKLKTILGLRAENYVQRHTGRDLLYSSGDVTNGKNLDNEVVLESLDLFPSANFIYSLTEEQNLRASYTRTIARPSFKELSFAQIIDPVSNRIFNGSLFEYSDWSGVLNETRIDNVDLRWELFMEGGQLFSVSAFYKNFDDPIELVRIAEQQTSTEFQARNVGKGTVYGVEVELSKNLAFLSPTLDAFSFNGNITLAQSQIEMTDNEYDARKAFERVGETIENTRQMAGQSPYVINAGLAYSNSELGLETGVFYNVKGATLSIVGLGLFPDIYLAPFHSLNFSISKKVGKNRSTSFDFKASNILNDDVQSIYRSYNAQDQIFSSLNPGFAFSLGISHKF